MSRLRSEPKEALTGSHVAPGGGHSADADENRRQLLAHLAIRERRIELAGIPTAVLEGGSGPPVVLLHDPGGHAAKWMRVLPQLMATHRAIVPDLPGHGASELSADPPDAARVLEWLSELIERTCDSPPVLVGLVLGGAIAARFAIGHGERISRLVLVDSLGLRQFEPAPEFGRALNAFLSEPTERAHDHLWRYCAFDLDRLRDNMGEAWEPFAAYNLDRARSPGVQAALHALMGQFGMPAIPPAELARIVPPTTLIWGQHDLATPVEVARSASARYGWPLQVIPDCADDPPIEQPHAFLQALLTAMQTEPEPQVPL